MMSDPHSNDVRRSKSEPKIAWHGFVRPSLRDFAYLDNQRRTELIAEQAAKTPSVRNLLDVGGREKPYASFFSGCVTNHYVSRRCPRVLVDVVGDARDMPFPMFHGRRLDYSVLEHVPDPVAVISRNSAKC